MKSSLPDLSFSSIEVGLLIACLLVVGSLIFSTLVYHAPPWPSTKRMRTALLDRLSTFHDPRTIVEAGAGWGGLAVQIARTYPQHSVIAAEVSVIPFLVCWVRSLFQSNLSAVLQSADKVIGDTDRPIMVTYVTGPVMDKLASAIDFDRRLDWVSIHFAVPDHRPITVDRVNDIWQTPVYHYEFGASI